MEMRSRILFVDDEAEVLESLARCVHSRSGEWACEFVASGREALARLAEEPFHVIVADMRMPGMDGATLLQRVRQVAPETVRVMLTGSTELWTAVEAINRGHVFHFLLKPCERDQLLHSVTKAVRQHQLQSAERNLLRAQLEHAQKLGLIGQMAAGVAHDLNNILATITLLSDTSWRNDPAAESPELRQIHEAALNAAALTRELTTFSRREADERLTPLDLREVVNAAAILVKPLLQKQARLVVKLPAEALPVLGDAGRLKQILVNLVINARDATPADGEITVEAERWEEPEGGPQVRLTVRDTGRGMDEATRQRMFEPFFTTKTAGQGTGLGLATVQELVDHHHGRVAVLSTPGQGTTFHIYLPAHIT
jgi:signal transduction histidine kinase